MYAILKTNVLLTVLLLCGFSVGMLAQKTIVSLRYDNLGHAHIEFKKEYSNKNNNKYLHVNFKGVAGFGTKFDSLEQTQITKIKDLALRMNAIRDKFKIPIRRDRPCLLNLFDFLKTGYKNEEMVWSYKEDNNSIIQKLEHRIYSDKNNFHVRDFLDGRDVEFKNAAMELYKANKSKNKKN